MDIMHKRLLELLEPRGVATELAKYLNVHPNTVGGWKSTLSKGYNKYLPQIAEYFDVSLDWLSGLSDDKNGHKKVAPIVSNKSDNRRLLESYLDDFSAEDEAALLAWIKERYNK